MTERKARPPNSAPAYYLGRPARLWITVMRTGSGATGGQPGWRTAGVRRPAAA
jgi:hypothetical protein